MVTPVNEGGPQTAGGSSDFHPSLLECGSTQWKDFEAELTEAGVPIALPNRHAWAAAHSCENRSFLAVRDGQGRAEAGVTVFLRRSRAIPGWSIAQVERMGPARSPEGGRALLEALTRLHRMVPRVLRLRVGVSSPHEAWRTQCVQEMESLGFSPSPQPLSYSRTLLISLEPSEEELFAQIHKTARQNVRAVQKNPVSVRPVVDLEWASRLEELSRETHERTGSLAPKDDWNAILELSAAEPGLSRILGLFEDGREGPQGLLAFAWGCFHGDHASYSSAASTRKTSLKMPFGHGLLWGLVSWSKETGASWFDMGGIPEEDRGSHHPLAGIVKFKRFFSHNEQVVGAEMFYESRPVLGFVSRAMSAAASLVRRSQTRA